MITINKYLLSLGLLFLCNVSVQAQSPVHEYSLENGLKVLVREDHRAPVVVSQIWYKVGSSYEYGGITGLSHMLEHMMFKGTEKTGMGEFSRIIAAQGGSENAFTGKDYTAYYEKLASDRLEIAFELESDRMRGLKLNEAEFLKERDVVAEERRMRTDDKPSSLAYEYFLAAAYQTSGYHHPVIGWMDDIQNYTIEDLADWYQYWYAPNNATLVVVGDVQAKEVFEMAEKYFSNIKPSSITPPKPQREIPKNATHRLNISLPSANPYLLMGYTTPSLNTVDETWEAYALYVLSAILDADDSARLSRDLVRGQEIAVSAGASYDLYSRATSLFVFSGTPVKGLPLSQLENALKQQIERLKTERVTDAELERVKTQVVASDIYEQDSVFYQAMRLGQLETVGLGWETGDDLVEQVKAVTADQVRAVAKKYLVDNNLTIAMLTAKDAEK